MNNEKDRVRQRAVVVGLCAAVIDEGDRIWIDRKAHAGLIAYGNRLARPITLVSPRGEQEDLSFLMDHILASRSELPYRVLTVAPTLSAQDSGLSAAENAVRDSSLFYGSPGTGLYENLIRAAEESGVPFVAGVEYSRRTELDIIALETGRNPVRRIYKSLRALLAARGRTRQLRMAREVHCNGYPSFKDYEHCNPNRVLYLDSRLSLENIVDDVFVRERHASWASGQRPFRLLFSGRYEKMKGADRVLDAVIELAGRRSDFEMDFYGKGALDTALRERVQRAGLQERIRVNHALPYPDLLEQTRHCDMFVSGSLQGDPSCTYLETLGCGLPIVGFGNEMWTAMAAASDAGIAIPTRSPRVLCDAIDEVLSDPENLLKWSLNAIRFASEHDFETEWDKRCQALQQVLSSSRVVDEEYP